MHLAKTSPIRKVAGHRRNRNRRNRSRVAFLFDLDGTLVDSVYPHVLAWSEALEKAGIELSIWRIHRRIGMSGGLFVNALLRETGHQVTPEEAARLQQLHAEAYRRLAPPVRPLPGARELLASLTRSQASRGPSPRVDEWQPRRPPSRPWESRQEFLW